MTKKQQSEFTIEEVTRDLVAASGPRPPCIEMVAPEMAEVLRSKTEWDRLKIAAALWRSGRQLLRAVIGQEHPEWAEDEVEREAARRMSHGLA